MPRLRVFCFLWDDPLFNPGADRAKLYFDDPEFIALRREERLLALEVLYIKLADAEKSAADWREAAGRHFWVLTKLRERVEIPREILESINVDQQVNMMDPDFSFWQWFKQHTEAIGRPR